MSDEIRERLRQRMTLDDLSTRKVGELCNMSGCTIWRFLKGKDMMSSKLRRVSRWLEGKPIEDKREVVNKIVKIKGHTLLITVEELP